MLFIFETSTMRDANHQFLSAMDQLSFVPAGNA